MLLVSDHMAARRQLSDERRGEELPAPGRTSGRDAWRAMSQRQAGALTTGQLLEEGVSRSRLHRLVEGGELVRVARGTFVVAGSEASWEQQAWAAVLAAGSGAVLFGRSAARWWGLDGFDVPPRSGGALGDQARSRQARPVIDVALPAGRRSRLPGTRTRRGLRDEETTTCRGLPITTVPRTLVDLGESATEEEIERAIESALRQRLTTLAQLADAARRSRGRPRRAACRVLDSRPAGAPPTESDAETRFAQLVRRGGFPDPRRQLTVVLGGRRFRLDFAWPAVRTAVEVDGETVHGSGALADDLRRQNRIVLDGWLLLRFTWEDIVTYPEAVLRELRAAWDVRSTVALARVTR